MDPSAGDRSLGEGQDLRKLQQPRIRMISTGGQDAGSMSAFTLADSAALETIKISFARCDIWPMKADRSALYSRNTIYLSGANDGKRQTFR